MNGYFKVPRGWMDNPVFKEQQFNEREAYLWLMESAVFKAQKVRINDFVLYLERGQCSFSLSFLAKKWGWSIGLVRGFLKKCEQHEIFNISTNKGITVITISNYSEIQDYENYTNTAYNKSPTKDEQTPDTKKKEGGIKDKKREKVFPFILEDLKGGEPHNQEFAKVMQMLHQDIGSVDFTNWLKDIAVSAYSSEEKFVELKIENNYMRNSVQAKYLHKIEYYWKIVNPNIENIFLR